MNPSHLFRVYAPRVGRLARAAGRDLWRVVARGKDEPPQMLRQERRVKAIQLLAAGLLLVLLAAVVVRTGVADPGGDRFALWMLIATTLSVGLLLVALRRPLLAWRIAWVTLLYELTIVAWDPDWFLFPPLFISEAQVAAAIVVLFLVAASQPRGVVFWVWLLTGTLVWATPLNWHIGLWQVAQRRLPARFDLDASQPPLDVAFSLPLIGDPDRIALQVAGVVLVTVVVLAGQALRYRATTTQRLAHAQEHGLVLAERARIARELHDVIAHHMSMIAVRAETAPYRLGTVPPTAREEFHEISRESRNALSEMRRLLGVLRTGGQAPPTTPQPGLCDLAELVEAARGAGAAVTVETHGAMSGLPAAVDVSAYRIVQEALTNASAHAVGAPVHITLRRAATALSLSVRNGPGTPSAPQSSDGQGVRGMRERAAMLGGALHAGPTAQGGFEVSATLPLGTEG